jgi:hypothetical protein
MKATNMIVLASESGSRAMTFSTCRNVRVLWEVSRLAIWMALIVISN